MEVAVGYFGLSLLDEGASLGNSIRESIKSHYRYCRYQYVGLRYSQAVDSHERRQFAEYIKV